MKKKRFAVEQLVATLTQTEPGILVAELKRTLLGFLFECLLLGGLIFQVACGSGGSSTGSGGTPGTSTYTTNFPLTENPISEGGHWINGKAVGLDWTNMQTFGGLASGTELSTSASDDDSTAVLIGTWGPNQSATGVVHMNGSPAAEIELRLRTTITAHSITGYEITCSSTYVGMAAWLGPLNSYNGLWPAGGGVDSSHHCSNGDKWTATAVGNVITAYLNGIQVMQVTDTTYPSGGSPGIGFFNGGGRDPTYTDLGWTSFTATDGVTVGTSLITAKLGSVVNFNDTPTVKGTSNSCTANFPLIENPISEGSQVDQWRNDRPGLGKHPYCARVGFRHGDGHYSVR